MDAVTIERTLRRYGISSWTMDWALDIVRRDGQVVDLAFRPSGSSAAVVERADFAWTVR